MLVSYRWLKQLVPGLTASPAEVATRLTSLGLEVGGVSPFGIADERVLLAEVLRMEPHPSRSGLRLVTVNRGGAEQQVVCGASNVPEPGWLVVLATLGVTLPNGMTMEPRKIGGVLSEGMLCSEVELGLAESSEGILVLPPGTAAPGTPFLRHFPEASDYILEVDLTPNRPDALGHVGVARELAAAFDLALVLPESSPSEASVELSALLKVDNRDTERCPHYAAGLVRGVTIAPSPHWLRWRLQSLGVRPISNVVDVTNLLLLESAQPMHAFDRQCLAGDTIIVRRAAQGEAFTTLDGVARQLDGDDLVIADASGATALAGVMGGQNSEIRETTRDVVLECAYFSPRGVRRTARRHGMHTESSHRFERGVDWAGVTAVLERAKSLLAELAGGTPVAGAIHAKGQLPALPRITVRSARVDALLGLAVPFAEAKRRLSSLGLRLVEDGAGQAVFEGAPWRPDLSIEADLIEEVARLGGLDAIPVKLPAIPPQRPRLAEPFERRVAHIAAELGLSEAVTYAFVSSAELQAVGAPAPVVSLSNPLTEERSVMRTSLLPGLLDVVRRARRHGQRDVRCFTVGGLFLPVPPPAESTGGVRVRLPSDHPELPEERLALTAVLAGARPGWLGKEEELDVWDAKGLAVELVERITHRSVAIVPMPRERAGHLHPRGAAELFVEGTVVGRFGPLHPDVVDRLDLDGGLQVVELDLAAIEQVGVALGRLKPWPKLPAVVRDLALELPESVQAGRVESVIMSAGGELCESVRLFDLYRGTGVRPGHRSLAFRVTYRDPKAVSGSEEARTLTDKEVDARQALVLKALETELGATLRA